MHFHQLSRASWPAKRARPHTHTKWWEADKPGKQTSHRPMVHIMFPDLTARDVFFPKHMQPPKSPEKSRSQSKFSLPKCVGVSTRANSVKETHVKKKRKTEEQKKSKGQYCMLCKVTLISPAHTVYVKYYGKKYWVIICHGFNFGN